MIFFLPPFYVGLINRVKSFFAGRQGPPLLQPYFDIIKLLRKGATYSTSVGVIFRAAPLVNFTAVAFAGAMLPLAGGAFSFYGDAILFVYLFGLARAFMILAALDTSSSFEGMGASREAAFGAFAELTIFASLATLAVSTHSLSLDAMLTGLSSALNLEPASLIICAALFFVALTENSRMPVDDPNTHLELTMVHEVMILDHSGPDLGIILWGTSIKLFLFLSLSVLVLWPNKDVSPVLAAAMTAGKVTLMTVLVGVVESCTARIRLIKVPQALIASFVLAVFAFLIAAFSRGML